APPRVGIEDGNARSAEQATAALALGDRILGCGDQVDRGLVRLAHRTAPRDGAMPLEDERARLRMLGDGVRDLARDLEAWPAVVERDDVLAVDGGEHVARPVVVGERDDRIRVRVDHGEGVHEAVQQRLDGGPHAAGILQRVREIGHHLLIAHLPPLEQRPNVVHADPGKILALDRFEIGAAALHAEHGDRAAAMIALDALDARVAAATAAQRGLGADEPRGVAEKVEALECRGLGVVPARLHRAPTISQTSGAGRTPQFWDVRRITENTCRSADDALNKNRRGRATRRRVRAYSLLAAVAAIQPFKAQGLRRRRMRAPEGLSRMQQLVDAARRDLDVQRKAADAGSHDNPKTASTSLDANESEVCTYFIGLARQRRESCEVSLGRLQLDRRATAARIDIEQTRDSFARLLTAIEPGLEKLKSDHAAGLAQAKENEARALKHLRWFQHKHALHHRAAAYPESQLYHCAIVAALALVEWVSLSTFYAEGSDFGLLGGVMIAMTLSIVNLSLAILSGSLLRYVNHRSVQRRWLALGAVTFLTACFLLVTLGAAHYRVATNDIAQSQPSTSAPGVNQVPPRFAVDVDQWRAAKLARPRLAPQPPRLPDGVSWVLVVAALTFGIFAAYKGYRFDDPYPGYGELDREVKTRRAAYEAAKAEYCRLVDQVFDRTLQEQAHLLSEVKSNIEYYQQLLSNTEEQRRTF